MTTRNYESYEQALSVAKEAVYLAWQACGGPVGMGVFQDRGPKQDKEAIWEHAYNRRDYTGERNPDEGSARIDCDYVMGRMMKLRFRVAGGGIEHADNEPRRDYQAWCGEYRTYGALFDSAEEACGLKERAA